MLSQQEPRHESRLKGSTNLSSEMRTQTTPRNMQQPFVPERRKKRSQEERITLRRGRPAEGRQPQRSTRSALTGCGFRFRSWAFFRRCRLGQHGLSGFVVPGGHSHGNAFEGNDRRKNLRLVFFGDPGFDAGSFQACLQDAGLLQVTEGGHYFWSQRWVLESRINFRT